MRNWTKLGNYSYKVKEDTATYQIYTEKDERNFDYDYDYDNDYDLDKNKPGGQRNE